MCKPISLVICIFLISCSQGEIYGSFYDFETNKPIKNAKITLFEFIESSSFSKVTYTNEAGFYRFDHLKKRKYMVSFEKEKYLDALINTCDLTVSLECNISSVLTSKDYKPKQKNVMPGIPSQLELKKYLEGKLKDSNIKIPNNLSLEEFYVDLEEKLKSSHIEIPNNLNLEEFIKYADKHLNKSSSNKPVHDKSIKANNADHAD